MAEIRMFTFPQSEKTDGGRIPERIRPPMNDSAEQSP